MKTHTQHHSNKEVETIETLSSQKRSEYRPRKLRGNTLVPVIIALSISAIATIAFLNQGANLAADNKNILAQNEIATIMQTWNILRVSYTKADIVSKGPEELTAEQVEFPSSSLKENVFGTANTFNATDNTLAYTTNDDVNCKSIQKPVSKMDGVSKTDCDKEGLLTITLE